MEDVEKIDDEQYKAWIAQLSDPGPYEFLRSLNGVIYEIKKKMGYETFLKTVFLRDYSSDIVIPHILAVINQYRNDEDLDLTILQGIIDTYGLLFLYSFEGELSNNTITYHKDILDNSIHQLDIQKFLSYMNGAIESEKKMFAKINLTSEICDEVIRRLVYSIFSSKTYLNCEHLKRLILSCKHEELRNLYQLHKMSSNLDNICDLWQEHLKEFAKDFFADDPNFEEFISLKNRHITIVTECFEDNEEMSKQIVPLLTARRGPLTGMCAKYVHSQLKNNTTEHQSVEELESWMQRVMDLFPFLDMPIFQQLHDRCLIKRFRSKKIMPIKAERLMLSKIPDYMFKDSILNDIEDDLLLDKQFEEYIAVKQIKLGLELDLKITQHHTFTGALTSLKFPPELARIVTIYNEFFASATGGTSGHQKKVLNWNFPQYSTCLIVGNFKHGSKELFVTLQQAITLLLFNEQNALSFDDIEKCTGVDSEKLEKILKPILRTGILRQNETSNEIILHYGKEFSSPNTEFDFTNISQYAPPQPPVGYQRTVLMIQARIVRVMKQKLELSQKELVREVYAQLGCRMLSLKPSEVTKEIDVLIFREFIKRSNSDRDVLEYNP